MAVSEAGGRLHAGRGLAGLGGDEVRHTGVQEAAGTGNGDDGVVQQHLERIAQLDHVVAGHVREGIGLERLAVDPQLQRAFGEGQGIQVGLRFGMLDANDRQEAVADELDFLDENGGQVLDRAEDDVVVTGSHLGTLGFTGLEDLDFVLVLQDFENVHLSLSFLVGKSTTWKGAVEDTSVS